MSYNQDLIAEMKNEAASTRKMLERVPTDKNDWAPHAKSTKLGRLATHVAEIPFWVNRIMLADELDFAKTELKAHVAASNEELVSILDEKVNGAVAILEKATDEDFEKPWSMRHGEKVFYTLPKKSVLRRFAYSHNIHHRGQLSVYLRLLDVPVPGMYGPSADER